MQYLSRRRTLGYASALALSLFSAVAASSHGRAARSRAGVIADEGNGTMDDLNGDARVDYRDAQVIAAAERVETVHWGMVQ